MTRRLRRRRHRLKFCLSFITASLYVTFCPREYIARDGEYTVRAFICRIAVSLPAFLRHFPQSNLYTLRGRLNPRYIDSRGASPFHLSRHSIDYPVGTLSWSIFDADQKFHETSERCAPGLVLSHGWNKSFTLAVQFDVKRDLAVSKGK